MNTISFKIYSHSYELLSLITNATSISKKKVEQLLDVNINSINMVVARDHQHLSLLTAENRPPWGVTKNIKNKIIMSNPLGWTKKDNGHDLHDLSPSIIHELIHLLIFQQKLVVPIWFEEGLAVYLSAQSLGNNDKTDEFERLIKQHDLPNILQSISFTNQDVPILYYLTSYKFVEYIVKKEKGLTPIKLMLKSNLNNRSFDDHIHASYNQSINQLWLEFKKNYEK